MTTPGENPPEPDPQVDFDAAWTEIVARWDDTEGAEGTAPQSRADVLASESVADALTDAETDALTDALGEVLDASPSDGIADDPLTPDPFTHGAEPRADSYVEERFQGDDDPLMLPRSLDDPDLLRPDPVGAWAPLDADEQSDDGAGRSGPDSNTYIPPSTPLPRSTPERWLAWVTAIAVPVLVVLATIFSYRPPELVSWTLGLGWVAAFAWLVRHMDDEPLDPWDDGSRV